MSTVSSIPLPGGGELKLGEKTLIMGVLNVTPDSFSDGGRFFDREKAAEQAQAMQAGGADIIDIGGESTRPGSNPVDAATEIDRVIPVIDLLRGKLNIPISIDTSKQEVARAAIEAGAQIINDISGGKFDPGVLKVAADHRAPLILMHTKARPDQMQKDTSYANLFGEIIDYLSECIDQAVAAGVERGMIIVDPGIGFGKDLSGNLALIKRLPELRILGLPILLGPSRKRFIGDLTGKPESERVLGTAAAVTAGIASGADIVRVHDVAEISDVVKVADAIYRKNYDLL